MRSADENSGSTAWDRTVDVCKRPEWLRGAATIDSSVEAEIDNVAEMENVEVEVDQFLMIPVAHDPTGWEVSVRQEAAATVA